MALSTQPGIIEQTVDDNLSPQQHQALSLLATGRSIAATARACHLHRSTIYHWQHENPDFARALRDAKHERTTHWHSIVDEHAAPAFAFIRATMDNDAAPFAQRLRAAFFLATQSLKPAPTPSKLELQFEQAERTRLRHEQETAAYYAEGGAEEDVDDEEDSEDELSDDSTDPTLFDTATPVALSSDESPVLTDPTQFDTSTPEELPSTISTHSTHPTHSDTSTLHNLSSSSSTSTIDDPLDAGILENLLATPDLPADVLAALALVLSHENITIK